MSEWSEPEFKVGDEVEWYEKDNRCRGRVSDDEGGLLVLRYDSFGNLPSEITGDATVGIRTAGLRRTSAVDLLAEKVPVVYHVRLEADAPFACGLSEDLLGVRDRYDHRESGPYRFNEWSDLIRATAGDLDLSDRSRPLDQRPLPDEAYASADKVRLCRDCFRCLVHNVTWAEEPGLMEDDELREFIDAWLGRRVFTDRHVDRPSHLRMVFMPLIMAGPIPEDYLEKVGCVWEFMDKAGPRAINGMPMFMSMRFMHTSDWNRAVEVIQAEEKRREALVLPPREG